MVRRVIPLLALFSVALLSTCDTGETPLEPEGPKILEPNRAIVDGSKASGNPYFHWQPPIMQQVYQPTGVFDEEVFEHLVVEICEWNGDACAGPPVQTFTPEGGLFSKIRMFPGLKVFTAMWKRARWGWRASPPAPTS